MNWCDQLELDCRVVRDSLIRVPTSAGWLMVDAYICHTKPVLEVSDFEKYIVSLNEKPIYEANNQRDAQIVFSAVRTALFQIDKDWEDEDAGE